MSRRYFVGFLFALVLGGCSAHWRSVVGQPMEGERTWRTLDGRVMSPSMAERIARDVLGRARVKGAELAILDGGKLVWSMGYGERAVGAPMTPSTPTWAASITKGVFATWVMTLVEQGALDLDTPVSTLLDRPLSTFAGYEKKGRELDRDPRFAKVTVRQLLTHTSGLANLVMLEPDQILRLHFPPGARYAYSGEGLNLLQVALETKLGRPLDVLLRETIFDPLAMTDTSLTTREVDLPRIADRFDSHGTFIEHTRRTHPRAAGSMTTSVLDLARFFEALLGGRVLRSLEPLLAPQIAIDARVQFPTFDARHSDEGPRVGLAYGLGWGLYTKTRFGPAFFKEGHGDGAQNYVVCFRDRGVCLAILTNSDNGERTFQSLLEGLLGDDVTPLVWHGYAFTSSP